MGYARLRSIEGIRTSLCLPQLALLPHSISACWMRVVVFKSIIPGPTKHYTTHSFAILLAVDLLRFDFLSPDPPEFRSQYHLSLPQELTPNTTQLFLYNVYVAEHKIFTDCSLIGISRTSSALGAQARPCLARCRTLRTDILRAHAHRTVYVLYLELVMLRAPRGLSTQASRPTSSTTNACQRLL